MKETIKVDVTLNTVVNNQANDSKLVDLKMVKTEFFNGQNMPCLSLPSVYELFRRADFPSIQIGRKWYAPRNLFIKWLEDQALNKTEKK